MEFAFLQDNKFIDLKEFKWIECLSVNQAPPQITFANIEYETDDGEIETDNSVYKPFEIEARFLIRHNNKFDRELRISEFYSFLCKRQSYYIIQELMPGKRYPVQVSSIDKEDEYLDGSILTVKFRAFKARSESIERTLDAHNITTQKWQHSQGMVREKYDYHFTTNNFSIYNLGDFTINPRRKHELKIMLKGRTDTGFGIYNKTTGDRFVCNQSLRKDEIFELEGIVPYKNGINCGISTNGGLITLAKGENKIQVQGLYEVDASFDFRFLYKV